jgi:hypothetical protein
MAQRWMAAKMILMARHGRLASGCNRATGRCSDDIKIGYRDETVPGTPNKKDAARTRAVCRKAERPMAWGGGRKARRAAQ